MNHFLKSWIIVQFFDHHCLSIISISYYFNITSRFAILIYVTNISDEEGRLLVHMKLNFRYDHFYILDFLYICEVPLT